MRCASCGEIIEGAPIWRDDEAYCSEECAEIGPLADDYDQDYEDYEEEYEEIE